MDPKLSCPESVNNHRLGGVAGVEPLSRFLFRVIGSLVRIGADNAARTGEKDGFLIREELAG